MAATADVGAAPRRAVIERRRLLDRLQRRFEVRLTLLLGGAGSGKTTLLTQAMAAESDHHDIWVPCRVADRDPERLIGHVLDALGGDPGHDDALDRIVERIIALSPHQVCLILDDVHVMGRGEGLDRVLSALPSNGHMLIASRARPPINVARLDAAGQLEEIEQDELLMTEDEVIEFANLRGIDVSSLEPAGGWPAFVELASTGTETRSIRYLDEEALNGIDADRRRALAAFSFVGGGDDEVARAVTGTSLDELVDGLPLVRWSGEIAQLHDLWADLLAGELDAPRRSAAANAAAAVARRHRDIDRAIDLGRLVDDWDDVGESLRAAVRHGVDGGLRADQIRRWRTLLPPEATDSAIGVLLEGLLERERDPTSPAATELLDRAAEMFEHDDEPELELVALTQLGYVARIAGDTSRIQTLNERFARLAEHHPPARPFTAIGEAWSALTTGRPKAQLEALMSIDEGDLPAVWQITRRHLIAFALLNLGRAHEALTIVPDDVDTMPVPIPGALVTRSQCQWYSGQPDLALGDPPRGGSDRHGARDRFIAAGWEAVMRGYSGDVTGLQAAVARAREQAGSSPSPFVIGQLTALDALTAATRHDDERAASILRSVFEVVPLEGGISAHMLRHHVALVYLLVPETRGFWDRQAMPEADGSIRTAIQALVAASEHDDLGPLTGLRWPEPGLIAAYVPVRWGMELALQGVRAGRHEARHLAAWLCEHWQHGALGELQRWSDDAVLADVARDVATHTPSPPGARVSVALLGHAEVDIDRRPTAHPDWRRDRVRALLAWLVLHPQTSREQAAAALWPELDHRKSSKNLRTTLNYLHGVLEPGRETGRAPWFVRSDGPRLELHGSLDVDVRRFGELLDRAEAAERAGHPRVALPLLTDAIELWRGDLAIDLDYEWLDLDRIHLRSRFVRAACRTAELNTAMGQGDRAIDPARAALEADPYHRASYRALAAAYRSVGDHTSARTIGERARAVGAWPD